MDRTTWDLLSRKIDPMKSRYVRRDVFGRVYLDECATEEEHFTRAPTVEEGERTRCRWYVDDLLADLVGKRGQLFFDIDFEEDEK